MTGRLMSALLLIATCGRAANLPRFAFTLYDSRLSATSAAVDSHGNTYLTGSIVGNPFVATPGAYQSQDPGGTCSSGTGPPFPVPCGSAFVIKLDPSGAVAFATYLGGSGGAGASLIEVDSQENVYVAGGAPMDGSFPVTPGAAFTSGGAFVAKLNASGSQLVYSTLIPGASLLAITADDAGDLYFTGQLSSADGGPFPATKGAYQSTPGYSLGGTIVGKLDPSGSALVWGTYLSGTLGGSFGIGIAVDAGGNVLIAGTNEASDFPATAGQFSTNLPNDDNVYLAKLSSDGSELMYATLLGPAQGTALAVSASGDIYIQCNSAGSSFQVTPGGFGAPPPSGSTHNFLLHVSADGSSVLNSIYLPFGVSAVGGGLDVDTAGNAYIVGEGPVQTGGGGIQNTALSIAPYEMVVPKITPDGQVAGVTYLGAAVGNSITALAAERDGSVVVAGWMNAVNWITPPLAVGVHIFLAINFFPATTIENSASYVANAVTPGEMVSIRGYGLGPAAGLNSGPVPELGGVQVYFDNFVAPIIYAQDQQINVQAPWEIAGQTATQVRIVYSGVAAGSAKVPVAAVLPGVFSIANSDGSLNSPSNPARAGDYVSVYGTGGGMMSPPGATGSAWPLAPLSSIAAPVSVTVGGEAAGVLYSGSAPTLGSWYFQSNVRLPADLTAGAQSLVVKIGGVASAPAGISIE
jgi:uncharacterized protein (TIGR03437 family)